MEGLAQRIVRRDVPDSLKDKREHRSKLGSSDSCRETPGDFEERLKVVLKDVQESVGAVFLLLLTNSTL